MKRDERCEFTRDNTTNLAANFEGLQILTVVCTGNSPLAAGPRVQNTLGQMLTLLKEVSQKRGTSTQHPLAGQLTEAWLEKTHSWRARCLKKNNWILRYNLMTGLFFASPASVFSYLFCLGSILKISWARKLDLCIMQAVELRPHYDLSVGDRVWIVCYRRPFPCQASGIIFKIIIILSVRVKNTPNK